MASEPRSESRSPSAPPRSFGSRALVFTIVATVAAVLGIVLWLGGAFDGPTLATDGPLVDETVLDDALALTPEHSEEFGGGERQPAVALALPDTFAPRRGVRLAGEGRLQGRVRERGTGEGIGGAEVELRAVPPLAVDFLGRVLRGAKLAEEYHDRILPIATTASAADGSFEFAGVREGTYFLSARGRSHAPDGAPHVVVAKSGRGGPVDVYVAPGGRVLGRVLLPNGRPAAGAKVVLFDSLAHFLNRLRTGDLVSLDAKCDSAGRFVIDGVPAREGYALAATGRGFAVTHEIGIDVVAGEDTHVELQTVAGASVSGVVLGETGAGADADLVPIAGAHVGVLPRGLRDVHFAEEILLATHATTDAEGRYVLVDAPLGQVDVLAFADAYCAGKSPSLTVDEGMSVEAEDIVLRAGPRLRGRVVDATGEPVPGVQVTWFLADLERGDFDPTFAPLMLQAIERFDYPSTDADGRFVTGALPGEPPFPVYFWKPGFQEHRLRWDPERDGEELEIVMDAGGSVEGIVLDALAAEPIREFLVEGTDRIDQAADTPSAWNPFAGGQLFQSDQGRFRVAAVKAGSRSLTFRAPGYQSRTVEGIDVRAGEVTRGLIVKLLPGGTLAGRVIDADGEPIAGVRVAARDADAERNTIARPERVQVPGPFNDSFQEQVTSRFMRMAMLAGVGGDQAVLTDEDGVFVLDGLPEGRWFLWAMHRDYAPARTETYALGPGASKDEIEIELGRGGGLEGRVSDRFDRPVRYAILLAMSAEDFTPMSGDASGIYQGMSDESGWYSIPCMRPGSYFVTLTRGDETLNPMSFLGTLQFDLVTVPAEGMKRYDVVDRSAAACRLHGVVTSAGVPVSGGGLFAVGFDTENLLGVEVKAASVDDAGRYEFIGLAPGEYQLTYAPEARGLRGGRGGGRGETRVEVEVPDLPEHRLDVALPEGGASGRVLDAASGAPISRAIVTMRSTARLEGAGGLLGPIFATGASTVFTRTDGEGRFELRGLREGEYELRVDGPRRGEQARDYAPSEPVLVAIEEGRMLEGVEVRLQPALRVEGVVLDENGAPVRSADVSFLPERESLRLPTGKSDADGRFTIDSLAAGTYDVSVYADGYAEAYVRAIDIPLPEKEILTVPLVPGVTVTAIVEDELGRPVPGAVASLLPARHRPGLELASAERTLSGFISGEGVCSADGRIPLGRFAPGSYRLEASRGSSKAVLEDVTVEGDAVELRVVLEGGE